MLPLRNSGSSSSYGVGDRWEGASEDPEISSWSLTGVEGTPLFWREKKTGF